MADFKRIQVNAAGEEDEVIMAGIATPEGAPEAETPAGPSEARETESPAKPAPPESPSETLREDAPPAARDKARRRPQAEDGYRETTLEDLQDGPMPAAQKITLIAAAVLLIVAIGYYFLFLA